MGGAEGSDGAGISVVPPPPGIGNGRGVWTAPELAHAASEPAANTMMRTRAITSPYRRPVPSCVVPLDSWHNGA